MTVLAGGSLDDAVAALGDAGAARASDVVTRLRDPRRSARAAVLAEVAKDVALAIDEVALR